MDREPNVNAMAVEIQHLQEGQRSIINSLDRLGGKVDGVVDALTSLVRLTEKHDALNDRVKKIEDYVVRRKEETDPVIAEGRAYMRVGSVVGSLVVIVGGGFITWLVGQVESTKNEIAEVHQIVARVEAHHENHRQPAP